MKDIGLMHYFLGLEVWQQPGEIFLGQGKYAVEILRRFRMEDCRPMSTPMITNLKKLSASEVSWWIPHCIGKLIGSLMYLVNTRLDICFVVNTLSQFMVEPRRVHWVASEACVEVSSWYNGLWTEICQSWWSGVAGVHRF
jgi:hypothetical protein